MAKKLIELKNITKKFGDNVVVDDLNLYINENEFITLVGPSGCGKTTILRMLGGFETPDCGEIILDGVVINNVPAHLRPINTVFQRYALFPHFNVFDNVAFGLRNFNRIMADIKNKVERKYENERMKLSHRLQNKEVTKEEKADIKLKLKDIKIKIKEEIGEEKENLISSKLEAIEKKYTPILNDLNDVEFMLTY